MRARRRARRGGAQPPAAGSRRVFWLAAALLSYTYVGFPALVVLRGWAFPRRHREAPITPSVTVVIAAHNEVDVIAAKVRNILAVDYPADRLDVLVVSDGSDDGTVEAARSAADGRAEVLDLPRVGKDRALNAAVERARGEILVFTDANTMFGRASLTALVAPFADPEVGGVAGDQRYTDGTVDDAVAGGERHYWAFDRLLKQSESRAGNVISATGAIYAIRRELFLDVPPGVTDDFATSTGVIVQGRRLVFAPSAVAYEPVGASSDAEFARKVRIMTRGLEGVVLRRELLDPRRHGFYALQLLSHKVLRRLMVVPLALLAASSARLARASAPFRLLAGGQAAVYALGLVGLAAGRRPRARSRVLALPAYFVLVNAASVRAISNVVRRRPIQVWEPQRGPGAPGR
ncbi:MAG TPA: glycosyltransferase family 2 protein [Solirubrobacteraceae bacterium]|nr:glycosyltransferase family 2 protein [Solirubrobacteraceae bacterium]